MTDRVKEFLVIAVTVDVGEIICDVVDDDADDDD